MVCRAALVLAVALAVHAPAHATYSGLVLIPTAETVGPGHFSAELQIDGPAPDVKADTWLLNTQFGIGNRIELGPDFDLSEDADPRLLFNAKYLFATWARGAGAAGFYNAGRSTKSNPYLVATHDFMAARLHLGAIRTESRSRWFAGADRSLGERWTLMADYTSGDENFSSLGLNYQFSDHLGVLTGLQFPNAGGDSAFTVHIVFGQPLHW